jgi:putative protease
LDEIPGGFKLAAVDEDGTRSEKIILCEKTMAQNTALAEDTIQKQLRKTGNTIFCCSKLTINLEQPYFIPVSTLNSLRREVLSNLDAMRASYPPLESGRVEDINVVFPDKELSFTGNVLNSKAMDFYKKRGVIIIEAAAEAGLNMHGKKVMTTKYCLKFQLDACPKVAGHRNTVEPLTLIDEQFNHFPLKFNCKECNMEVYYQ